MRLHRPVLAGLALGTLLPVTAASAATGVTAAGSALSSATIASVSVGSLTIGTTVIPGASVALGTLSATAETINGKAPSVTFVPVTVNGTETGAVTVTPANSPKTVGGVATGALPLNILSATSPTATLTAANPAAAPTSSLKAALGSVSVLGMPITLDGGLNVGSVTDATHAKADKTLTIQNVTLPSLADLLAALGIDIAKLPASTLFALVEELPMVIDSVTAGLLAASDTAIADALVDVSEAQNTVDTATEDLATATDNLDTALGALDAVAIAALGTLPTGVDAPLDSADWDTLGESPEGQTIQGLLRADSAIDSAADAYEQAKGDLQDANDVLDGLVDTLNGLVDTLAGIVEGVLSDTPLAKVGAAKVGTNANVGSTKAATVTGYVSGVEVMGLDVLKEVTGNSKVDAAKLVGDVADQVNDQIAGVTQTLSDVLSDVTGAIGLNVPAPSIEVLAKTTKTGVAGAFGTADATVTALSVTMPSATIPDAFALAGAGSLPGIGDTASGFKTAPLSIKVGSLTDAARFRPASGTTPTTPNTPDDGDLASTGVPSGLGIVALIGVALAVATRRRLRTVPVS
jgi:hypothetical protein